MHHELLSTIRHGLIMAVTALIFGALWAAYLATNHDRLHGAFEAQEEQLQQAQMQHLMEELSADAPNATAEGHSMGEEQDAPGHDHGSTSPAAHEHGHDAIADSTGEQHSHSGSLAQDAMQRLLRGHIHFMGLGVLVAALLMITAFTCLKPCWKKLLGWTFGLGALAYPPAWILMGYRTVELGPAAAEASVMWLFAPAVGLLLFSMGSLLGVLLIEMIRWNEKKAFQFLFGSG
ncbi:MAG: hypothetical protein RQ867_08540 [Mariprofundaceae bacterium]|nr:hypothetical protein [Mariprofundaceae bacterium]